MAEETERIHFFDNIKGLCIILVVIGHFIVPFSSKVEAMSTVRECIYLFHMPLFCMVSGYFQKKRIENRDYKKVFTGIAIPYLIQNTALYLFMLMTQTGGEYSLSYANYNPFIGLWSFWYLFGLLIWCLFTMELSKLKVPSPVILLIALVIYFAIPFSKTITTFNFSKVCGFYVFFAIGYCLKDTKIIDFIRGEYTGFKSRRYIYSEGFLGAGPHSNVCGLPDLF